MDRRAFLKAAPVLAAAAASLPALLANAEEAPAVRGVRSFEEHLEWIDITPESPAVSYERFRNSSKYDDFIKQEMKNHRRSLEKALLFG